MDYKWIGAVLIISACGGFGFSLCTTHRREEHMLRTLTRTLDYMVSELHYHATPLPDLCRLAAAEANGNVGQVFRNLAKSLEEQISPEVSDCMDKAVQNLDLPPLTMQSFLQLGSSLGRFDLEGQLNGLETVRSLCRGNLEKLSANRDSRLRNYQTLSLCAGAALAILLI
jgi:stage III sporulation protein AB